jgi:phage shock protein PspC (stress-responsive transcriptional regulator)
VLVVVIVVVVIVGSGVGGTISLYLVISFKKNKLH